MPRSQETALIRRDYQNGRPPRARLTPGRALRWLLLVPFLMLATISQGTMIEAAPAGGMRIVLCTGDGMVDAIMTPDGQVHRADEPGRGGHPGTAPCDWALHGQSVLASPAIDMIPPLVRELDADHGIDIPLHVRRAEVLTPAARGPPTLV